MAMSLAPLVRLALASLDAAPMPSKGTMRPVVIFTACACAGIAMKPTHANVRNGWRLMSRSELCAGAGGPGEISLVSTAQIPGLALIQVGERLGHAGDGLHGGRITSPVAVEITAIVANDEHRHILQGTEIGRTGGTDIGDAALALPQLDVRIEQRLHRRSHRVPDHARGDVVEHRRHPAVSKDLEVVAIEVADPRAQRVEVVVVLAFLVRIQDPVRYATERDLVRVRGHEVVPNGWDVGDGHRAARNRDLVPRPGSSTDANDIEHPAVGGMCRHA